LHDEYRYTTIYVTHDQSEAMTTSDVIAVMNAGRIEQAGSPEDIYDRPRSEFVARFIGSSNVIKGPRLHDSPPSSARPPPPPRLGGLDAALQRRQIRRRRGGGRRHSPAFGAAVGKEARRHGKCAAGNRRAAGFPWSEPRLSGGGG